MNKNKIPAVLVSNIYLRNALLEALLQSKHKIDTEYTSVHAIKDKRLVSFILNDVRSLGAGFANISDDHTNYEYVSLEKMFELLASNPYVPVEVKLNSEYTAIIQEDGSVNVGCQSFPYSVIVNLVREMEKVIKNKN